MRFSQHCPQQLELNFHGYFSFLICASLFLFLASQLQPPLGCEKENEDGGIEGNLILI